MKRVIAYPTEQMLVEDFLTIQVSSMKDVGRLVQAITGGAAVVDGVACTPTAPASLAVNLGVGTLFFPTVVDVSAFSTLPPDAGYLMKVADFAGVTLPISAPTGVGQEIVYLIQASASEPDDTPNTLNYFDSANTAITLSGVGGNGLPQNTRRTAYCNLSLKAGAPAASGQGVAPGNDPGSVPLWLVTLEYGQTHITASNIREAPGAPRFRTRLTGTPLSSNDLTGFALQSSLNNTNTALSGINTYVSNTVRFSNEATYYASNTFVVPPACYALRVRVAGGGGGGGSQINSIPGGGGGAGGYAEGYYLVTPGQVIPITIGAGGSGGKTGSNGGPGGSTSFGTLIAATGGVGGEGGSGGNPAGGPGGNGVGGQFLIIGGSGFDGVTGTSLKGGDGGSSAFGGGGRASTGAVLAQQGQAVGSGGGAGYANENAPGGSGQGGAVIIEF